MEKLGGKIFFLGRVIERTTRGYSVEGLEDSRPVSTPSVKRTPTTESLVVLETERRAVYRTAVGKLLYTCQGRADIMYSAQETARKIMCPTESDEMNVKRIAGHLKGVPIAKCLFEINSFPPFVDVYKDSDWAGQHQTCKSTDGGVTQWGSTTLSAWSRTQQSVSLSSAEPELYALTTGISEGMVTKHLLIELGYEVTLANMFVQDVVEKKQTTLAFENPNSNEADLMTKWHTFEAHMKGCAMLGLKLSRDDGKLA